jgi:DNA-binding NtrC family response regulator
MKRVLVVDDEASIFESLRMALDRDYELIWAASAKEAIKNFHEQNPDLVLLDIIMPGVDGMEVLKSVRDADASIPVIMLTATKMVRTAVEAMKKGANDYLMKPFDVDELKLIIGRALMNRALEREVELLRSEVEKRYRFHNFVGKSRVMRDIYSKIEHFAQTKSTVLITGESGTGKELVARALHYNSPRKDKPLVAINCAAIPEGLIESELFGYEKGAFTHALRRKVGQVELAHGGTLFLDEIGDLSVNTQAKLLRMIQEKEIHRLGGAHTIRVDVRVISATNKDLLDLISKKSFREDLYYRINVVSVHLPPLRARREDIPLLVRHFLEKKAEEDGTPRKQISAEALDLLSKYSWPGNVRELENVMEQTHAMTTETLIQPHHLPIRVRDQVLANSLKEDILNQRVSLDRAIMEFEREIISEALKKSRFVQTHAASLLGISRRVLKYKMDMLGMGASDAYSQNSDSSH